MIITNPFVAAILVRKIPFFLEREQPTSADTAGLRPSWTGLITTRTVRDTDTELSREKDPREKFVGDPKALGKRPKLVHHAERRTDHFSF